MNIPEIVKAYEEIQAVAEKYPQLTIIANITKAGEKNGRYFYNISNNHTLLELEVLKKVTFVCVEDSIDEEINKKVNSN